MYLQFLFSKTLVYLVYLFTRNEICACFVYYYHYFQKIIYLSNQILQIRHFRLKQIYFLIYSSRFKRKVSGSLYLTILQMYMYRIFLEAKEISTIVINGTFFPALWSQPGSISTTTTDFRKYEGARHWTSRWTNPSPIPACGTETPRNQILILR